MPRKKQQPETKHKQYHHPILNSVGYSDMPTRYKELFDCYYLNKFHIGKTCMEFGITRNEWYKIYNSSETFRDIVDDCQQFVIDTAECTLMDMVEEKDFRAIQFLLNKKGKERGYGDQPTQTQLIFDKGCEDPFAKIRENENIK